MKWYEFTSDNGDGSYSKMRFRTREEANAAKDWLEENDPYFMGDGDGVESVDTDSDSFFDTLDAIKKEHDVDEE